MHAPSPAAPPDIALPVAPSQVLDSILELGVSFNADVTEDQFASLIAAVPLEDDKTVHSRFRKQVVVGSAVAEQYGHIGIHDMRGSKTYHEVKASDNVGKVTGCWVHYKIGVRRDRSGSDLDENWQHVYGSLAQALGVHSSNAEAFLQFPVDTPLTFKLPIPMSKAEVPGFSEIRGVQLVKTDTSDPSSELYSAILTLRDGRQRVSITAVLEQTLGREALTHAWDRTFAVTRLLAPTLEGA